MDILGNAVITFFLNELDEKIDTNLMPVFTVALPEFRHKSDIYIII